MIEEVTMNDIADLDVANSALAIIPAASLPTLVSADKTDILGKLRAELAGYKPDGSTEAGRSEIGSKARKVGSAKQDFVRLADVQKEDHQTTIKRINGELRQIEENCDALRDAILAPRVAYVQREKDRVAAHESALDAIAEHPDFGRVEPAHELARRLDHLRDYPVRSWQEFQQRADEALTAEIVRTERLLAAATKREAEAFELARLRAEEAERARLAAIEAQRIREERIAAEAADRARQEAEAKAERDAQAERDAVAKSQRDAAEAFERFQAKAAAEALEAERQARASREMAVAAQARAAKADADRIQAEAEARRQARIAEERAEDQRQAAIVKAEREKADAIEAERRRVAQEAADAEAAAYERAADQRHRGGIMRAAKEALMHHAEIDEDIAKRVVLAISRSQVPAVSMKF